MKKYIPLLSALALALLLTACVAAETEETAAPTPTSAETAEETLSPAPAGTPDPEGTDTPTGSFSVYTDWSRLEPYQPKTAVYTRRYKDFTDTLIPANNYGPLLPFAGAAITGVEEWDDGYYRDFYLYGLMTNKGEVVVDPVLLDIVSLPEMDSRGNVSANHDVMLLGKAFYNEEGTPEERYALCDREGRWCTDFLYTYNWENYFYASFAWGVPLFTVDGKLAFCDVNTGKEMWTLNLAAHAKVPRFSVSGLRIDPATGWVCLDVQYWDEKGWEDLGREQWLFDSQGQFHTLPDEVGQMNGCGDGLVLALTRVDEGVLSLYRWGYVDAMTGEWAIRPMYTNAKLFVNGVAPVDDGKKIYFINTDGEALTDDLEVMPERYGRYWYVNNSTGPKLFDEEANPVTDSLLADAGALYQMEDGWLRGRIGEDYFLARGDEVYHFPANLGTLTRICGNRVLFEGDRREDGTRVLTLTDLEGNLIARWDNYGDGSFILDEATGESYLYMSVPWRTYEDYISKAYGDYYDMDGNCVESSGERVTIIGGLVYRENRDCSTLTDFGGNLVFCWPIQGSYD